MDMVLKHHAKQDRCNGEKWGEKWQNRRAESRDEDFGSNNYRCPPGSDNHVASPSASAASFFHDIASPSASAASIFHDVASPSASAALKISRCRRCSRFRCLALPHHCLYLAAISNFWTKKARRFGLEREQIRFRFEPWIFKFYSNFDWIWSIWLAYIFNA